MQPWIAGEPILDGAGGRIHPIATGAVVLGQLRQPPTVGTTYLQDPGRFAAQIFQRLEDGIICQGFFEDGGLVALVPLVPFLSHEDVFLLHLLLLGNLGNQ
ncbi:hypothetical protein D3C78_1741530 [compost metagenome]